MSIATAITNLQGRIANAYTAISNKGGTLPATQDSANLSATIDSIPAGGGGPVWGITALSDVCYTDANGKARIGGGVTGDLIFTGVKDIADNGFYGAFRESGVKSVSFPDLSSVNTASLREAFKGCGALTDISFPALSAGAGEWLMHGLSGCTSLSSVSFPELSAIKRQYFENTFQGCTSLISVSFPKVVSISEVAMPWGFQNCTALTSISFPELTAITTGNDGMMECFMGCSSLAGVQFPKLTTITGRALVGTFKNCTSLTSVTFPALTTIAASNQVFKECFANTAVTELSFPELSGIYNVATASYGVFMSNATVTKIYFPKLVDISSGASSGLAGKILFNGCTNLVEIHFAEANQTLIESAAGYATKWGAPNANCQVYFDL